MDEGQSFNEFEIYLKFRAGFLLLKNKCNVLIDRKIKFKNIWKLHFFDITFASEKIGKLNKPTEFKIKNNNMKLHIYTSKSQSLPVRPANDYRFFKIVQVQPHC